MKRKLLSLIVLVAAVTLVTPVPAALAATFTANSTADESDFAPGDGVCLTAAGECTLRAAIQEANALGGGQHTIMLVAGAVYSLTRTGAGEDAAATGDLDIASDLTLTVPGGRAVVEGTSGWDDRIFEVLATTTVHMDALDIRNGQAVFSVGGGIANLGTLTVTNSTVSGNSASLSFAGGGGIWNHGTLTVTSSTVSGNSAVRDGGGIYNDLGTLTLTNSTISGNSAGYGGGGIYGFFTVTVTSSTISGNSAGYGGGIYYFGKLTVTSSTVGANSAGFDGGGIYLGQFGSSLTARNSTISTNSAERDGGGVYVQPSTSLTATNATISGNSAARNGGGISNLGTVSTNNVTIARNVADSDADATGDGGGIINVSGGSVVVANTIVGDNLDASASAKFPDCLGSLTAGGFDLIENTTGCAIGGITTGTITGRDPLLGPLQNNGGPTLTHALLVQTRKAGDLTYQIPSPAIDTGNPGILGTLCPGSDQRNFNRPVDGNADGAARCDIGAYEYGASPFKLGTWSFAPAEASARAGEPVTYRLTWTVPEGRGWRSLDTLQLRFLDDQGTALWLRFQEVAGAPGVFSVVDAKNGNAGPSFAPGSPNRLESEFATLYLAETSVDGPPGRQVTLTLTLSFKPNAAGRVYDVLVAATDDAGEVQGFHRAGTVAVTG
jgi:CSLREA domain-containing protein